MAAGRRGARRQAALAGWAALAGALAGSPLAAQTLCDPSRRPAAGADTAASTANERFARPGVHHQRLQPLVGRWRVRQTVRADAGAQPVAFEGITACRGWLEGGGVLYEVMEGAPNGRPFTRVALLTYNNIEQRFELASTDTRTPGVMSLQNVSDDGGRSITFHQTFTLGGRGRELSGQTVRLRHVLHVESAGRAVMQQFWTLPAAREFLAIEYVYTRIE